MSDRQDDWSLRKEINKRRTQQASVGPKPSTPPEPKEPSPRSAPPSRSTETGPPLPPPIRRAAVEPPPAPQKPRRSLYPLLLVGGLAIVLLSASLFLLLTLSSEAPVQPTISYEQIKFRAEDVVEYLRRAGVPISDLRVLAVPSPIFSATQGFQFLVVRGDQVGSYIVLSYDPIEELGRNALSLSLDPTYKDWRTFTAANIRVLFRPNNASTLDAELESHLISLLDAPFRAVFPTTTGSPIAAALLQTLTAQPTPTRLAPTATFVIVTLAPEERATANFTPQGGMFQVTVTPQPTLPPRELRPTITPFPTRTPISAGFSAILTRAPGQPTISLPSAPTASAPTAALPGTPPPTAQPGVLILNETPVPVAILPTVAPREENSASFNDRAPRFVDPFRLIPEASTTNRFGSTLLYVLPNGTQYLAVLWITNSPDEAFQRYSADLASISGYQRVSVGEAGIITAPQNYVMAMAIRANMVLIIYRPPEFATVPSDPVSVEQVAGLLQALYNAIPAD